MTRLLRVMHLKTICGLMWSKRGCPMLLLIGLVVVVLLLLVLG